MELYKYAKEIFVKEHELVSKKIIVSTVSPSSWFSFTICFEDKSCNETCSRFLIDNVCMCSLREALLICRRYLEKWMMRSCGQWHWCFYCSSFSFYLYMLEEKEPLRLRFDYPRVLWGQIRQLGEDFGSNCNILKALGPVVIFSCFLFYFSW